MATTPTAPPPLDQPASPANAPTGRKAQRWFELCLVLFISFGGSVYTGIYYLHHIPNPAALANTSRALFAAGQAAVTIVLLGYVLSRTAARFGTLDCTGRFAMWVWGFW